MENKIKQILEILNGISCVESKFILTSAIDEVELQQREKTKDIIFKI